MKVRLLLVALLLPGTDAFSVVSSPTAASTLLARQRPLPSRAATVLNMAKKRRRRKTNSDKAGPPDPAPASVSPSPTDLPDFDLNDDGGGGSSSLPDFEMKDEDIATGGGNGAPNAVSASVVEPSKGSSSKNAVVKKDESGVDITEAMMGSTSKPVKSVEDLISDRSLEKNFVFDENSGSGDITKSIPDFDDFAQMAEPVDVVPEGTGKKKARQAARKAAALRALEEENKTSFLDSIPFIKDEKGEVNPVKILEAGAWGGIFLLVLWEVYLNSPFFQRAAPMAPVVYDLWM